jgi:large subunit ribosomal protein L25
MAPSDTTKLPVQLRDPDGSRSARRLRREGLVPGIVYGGGKDPLHFQVDARVLRNTLAHSGAVIDLDIDEDGGTPVVLKDHQRHPVTGESVHVDMLRVRLDKPIHAAVALELLGVEEAPGVKAGGVLDQVTRELNIEALPTSIPDSIQHEIGEMEIGDTLTLEAIRMPSGVALLDDAEQVVATLSPPKLSVEPDEEIEAETELVGEDGEPIEGEAAEGDGAGEGEAPAPEGDGGGDEGE